MEQKELKDLLTSTRKKVERICKTVNTEQERRYVLDLAKQLSLSMNDNNPFKFTILLTHLILASYTLGGMPLSIVCPDIYEVRRIRDIKTPQTKLSVSIVNSMLKVGEEDKSDLSKEELAVNFLHAVSGGYYKTAIGVFWKLVYTEGVDPVEVLTKL